MDIITWRDRKSSENAEKTNPTEEETTAWLATLLQNQEQWEGKRRHMDIARQKVARATATFVVRNLAHDVTTAPKF